MKTNQKVERLCEIVFMVFMKVAIQLIVLPKCIASFVAYFVGGLGSDSFELPVPMW